MWPRSCLHSPASENQSVVDPDPEICPNKDPVPDPSLFTQLQYEFWLNGEIFCSSIYSLKVLPVFFLT